MRLPSGGDGKVQTAIRFPSGTSVPEGNTVASESSCGRLIRRSRVRVPTGSFSSGFKPALPARSAASRFGVVSFRPATSARFPSVDAANPLWACKFPNRHRRRFARIFFARVVTLHGHESGRSPQHGPSSFEFGNDARVLSAVSEFASTSQSQASSSGLLGSPGISPVGPHSDRLTKPDGASWRNKHFDRIWKPE